MTTISASMPASSSWAASSCTPRTIPTVPSPVAPPRGMANGRRPPAVSASATSTTRASTDDREGSRV